LKIPTLLRKETMNKQRELVSTSFLVLWTALLIATSVAILIGPALVGIAFLVNGDWVLGIVSILVQGIIDYGAWKLWVSGELFQL
jgi:hypothetical protein